MGANPSSASFTVTSDTVRERLESRANHKAGYEQDDKWLAAAEILVGPDLWQQLTSRQPEPHVSPASSTTSKEAGEEDPAVWIISIIEVMGQGMTSRELFDLARVDAVGGTWASDEPLVFKQLMNLSRRGRVRKRGDFFYTPSLLALIEAGETKDRPDAHSSDLRTGVLKVLEARGKATSAQVLADLRNNPLYSARAEKSANNIYNILSRLFQYREIVRDADKAYSIAPKVSP